MLNIYIFTYLSTIQYEVYERTADDECKWNLYLNLDSNCCVLQQIRNFPQ